MLTELNAGVGAWRLTTLLQDDAIAEPVRDWMARHFPKPGEYVAAPFVALRKGWTPICDESGEAVGWLHREGTKVGEMFDCPRCLSVWCAAALLVAARIPGLRVLGRVLTVAGVALLAHTLMERMEK